MKDEKIEEMERSETSEELFYNVGYTLMSFALHNEEKKKEPKIYRKTIYCPICNAIGVCYDNTEDLVSHLILDHQFDLSTIRDVLNNMLREMTISYPYVYMDTDSVYVDLKSTSNAIKYSMNSRYGKFSDREIKTHNYIEDLPTFKRKIFNFGNLSTVIVRFGYDVKISNLKIKDKIVDRVLFDVDILKPSTLIGEKYYLSVTSRRLMRELNKYIEKNELSNGIFEINKSGFGFNTQWNVKKREDLMLEDTLQNGTKLQKTMVKKLLNISENRKRIYFIILFCIVEFVMFFIPLIWMFLSFFLFT